MRKLTGYIGALIVVFALMGSILMGYALNVNGESTVINEYEKVTDVSGLYTHSQEPSYIDYNPASNYIGYSYNETYTADIGLNYCKEIIGNKTIKITPTTITADGRTITLPTQQYIVAFVTDKLYIQIDNNTFFWIQAWDGVTSTAYEITITTTNTSVTVSWGANTYSYSDCNKKIRISDNSDYDYYMINGRQFSNTTDYTAYYTDKSDIVTISRMAPAFNSDTGSMNIITVGTQWSGMNSNVIYNTMPGSSGWMFNSNAVGNNGVYTINANYQNWTHSGWDSSAQPTKTISGWFIFYPATKTYSGVGINYTESNRVNNYPIETDYDTSQTTSTASMDLMAVSVANQFNGSRAIIDSSNSNGYTGISYVTNVYSYKLSDLMQLMNIPANTTAIKFDCPSGVYNISVAKLINGQTVYFGSYFLSNYAVITGPDTGIDRNPWQDYYTFAFNSYASQYVMYYPDTQICELFDKDGVKIGNYSGPDKIFITFVTNTTNDYPFRTQGYNADAETQYTIPARPKPFMNIFYSVTGTVTDVHYSDITKGYSIKSSNITNVIWDNQYNNGNIQLLFRAEDTNSTYHNDITVGDNTISVDYNNGFSVTLNSGDPVAVGKWRNIVLDINLNSGELSAVPVRTFNSYTNVVLDTSRMVIGDLVNPAPTNKIEWAPTPNSLMFNVYSTSVFMDTYGVVMVNPTLDITDYFTDLNDFYRLRLYNFSVYGDNITVNGVTADVSGNSINIDDQTIQLKEMSITYADGHAYISDSNATIDLGAIVDNDISMSGAWYFETELNRGYTTQKTIYNWNWSDFILDNTQFCIMFMGLAIVALIVARHYCTMAITDYIVLVLSFIIALTVQVVA